MRPSYTANDSVGSCATTPVALSMRRRNSCTLRPYQSGGRGGTGIAEVSRLLSTLTRMILRCMSMSTTRQMFRSGNGQTSMICPRVWSLPTAAKTWRTDGGMARRDLSLLLAQIRVAPRRREADHDRR